MCALTKRCCSCDAASSTALRLLRRSSSSSNTSSSAGASAFLRIKESCRALPPETPGDASAFLFFRLYDISTLFDRDFGAEGDYDTLQTFGPGGPDAQWGPGVIWGTTPPSTQARFERRTKVSAMTPRGFHFGQEYYGTFSRSLYTLFQVRRVRSPSPATQLP